MMINKMELTIQQHNSMPCRTDELELKEKCEMKGRRCALADIFNGLDHDALSELFSGYYLAVEERSHPEHMESEKRELHNAERRERRNGMGNIFYGIDEEAVARFHEISDKTESETLFDSRQKQRRNAMFDIFYGIDKEQVDMLFDGEDGYFSDRTNSEYDEIEDEVMFQNKTRRNGLHDIFYGINRECVMRLFDLEQTKGVGSDCEDDDDIELEEYFASRYLLRRNGMGNIFDGLDEEGIERVNEVHEKQAGTRFSSCERRNRRNALSDIFADIDTFQKDDLLSEGLHSSPETDTKGGESVKNVSAVHSSARDICAYLIQELENALKLAVNDHSDNFSELSRVPLLHRSLSCGSAETLLAAHVVQSRRNGVPDLCDTVGKYELQKLKNNQLILMV